ncbi:FYVE-type domain-containing protein [Mycena indigotica]|uniref:FYVE-type domain-containing protein n=1 Tax=Mycena indigotica TaxID=2126181 RepID=A0A8H6S9B8_9AGAR|nr:FYVE-type domain-containing protein [Mycena indigotica]KAF7295356.1 FYVE-type domain-containing protein [Mycena indigotica]
MTDNAPSVPYQAYRSKRHSYTSNAQVRTITVPAASPPTSRPTSLLVPASPPAVQNGVSASEKDSPVIEISTPETIDLPKSPPLPVVVLNPSPPASPITEPEPPLVNGSPTTPSPQLPIEPPSSPAASSSTALPDDKPRKTSTFRRVPRAPRTPLPSSPLAGGHTRTISSSSLGLPAARSPLVAEHSQRPASVFAESSLSSSPSRPSPLPSLVENRRHSTPLNADAVAATLATTVVPPQRTSSLQPTSPASISRASSATISRQTSPSPAPPSPSALSPPTPPRQTSAPYRPGFQPKGVYRPRTDEFIAHRQAHAVSAGYASSERTKLERRLEKLISLHFPNEAKRRPGMLPQATQSRRASSFFDIDIKSILSGGKEDTRSAEQRITPWEEDSAVSKCPLCLANFHQLTNRKHHCRLCGQIICAQPVKRPQRPQLCSILFVVDPKTREIEEVGEGVDYGVRKRKTSTVGGPIPPQELAEEEKFLRGVRICNQCRPVLLRQQYHQQATHVPTFVRLYDAFIALEKEIEDSLPQFQELILSLTHDSQPTKEASAARKRLLEAFAQYDAIAKRIRNLAAPNGGSQERVQIAVMTRANLFLQKNMFPLQSLPMPKRANTATSATPVAVEEEEDLIDPSSATALALQPLLEQEALLETYVEEAKAQRKFEDAKTLRVNLGEIRAEIERLLAAEGLKGRKVKKAR